MYNVTCSKESLQIGYIHRVYTPAAVFKAQEMRRVPMPWMRHQHARKTKKRWDIRDTAYTNVGKWIVSKKEGNEWC
jgi:hypothetical protein